MIVPTSYVDLGGGAGDPGRPIRKPVIVWIGNVGNEEYLDLVRAPLQRLARSIAFVLRVIGSSAAMRFRIPGVDVENLEWSEDEEGEWLLGSSIGIMPLQDREYERGKCAFKLIQYFSAGLPVVASPVGMNSEVVVHGGNGFLAASDDEWHEYLLKLLESAELRRRMGGEGYATYRRRFTRDHNAALWVDILRNVRVADLARAA